MSGAKMTNQNNKLDELRNRAFDSMYAKTLNAGTYIKGWGACADILLPEIQKLREALEFECGNRCAEQNPCNAKEVLRESKERIG
jgi:hypothetical protein